MARKKPKPPSRKASAANAEEKVETKEEEAGSVHAESKSQDGDTQTGEDAYEVESVAEVEKGNDVESTRLEDERQAEAAPSDNVADAENKEKDEWIAKLREENELLHIRLKDAQEAQAKLQEAIEERDVKIEALQAQFTERTKIDEGKKENALSGLEKQRESMNRLQERLANLKKEQEEAERVKKEAWVELRKRVQAVVDSVCQPLQS